MSLTAATAGWSILLLAGAAGAAWLLRRAWGDRTTARPWWIVAGWAAAAALIWIAALMLFVLLYSPCFVALIVIAREAGSWKWVLFGVFFNTALAFSVAVAAYNGMRLFLPTV